MISVVDVSRQFRIVRSKVQRRIRQMSEILFMVSRGLNKEEDMENNPNVDEQRLVGYNYEDKNGASAVRIVLVGKMIELYLFDKSGNSLVVKGGADLGRTLGQRLLDYAREIAILP